MGWPQSQDYNESIQNPRNCFKDAELSKGLAVTNAFGMPLPCSGNFADVYQVHCPETNTRWAVKCFTRGDPDSLRQRYAEIDRHLQQAKLPFGVGFRFLDEGIRIRNQWHPVLKMQWIEGFTLNHFVRDHLDKPKMLDALLQIWVRMAKRLREANLAHADLQHGNVLLVPGSEGHALRVKLIDYDGMWVPALAGQRSGEVGHPAYQHSQRLRDGIYSKEVDRFPLMVVATSLCCLSVSGRSLWEKYDNGDNLLFRESDLAAPQRSPLFAELVRIQDAQTQQLVDALLKACRQPLEQTLLLDSLLPEAAPAPRPVPVAEILAPNPVLIASVVPRPAALSWFTTDQVPAPLPITSVVPPPPEVRFAVSGGEPAAKRKAAPELAAPSRRAAPRRRVTVRAAAAGFVAAVILLAVIVFRVETPKGTLVVVVDDPNVEVLVKMNAAVVQDKTTQREFTLTAGDNGEIEVYEKKGGIRLTTKKFALTKGGRETVRVTLEELDQIRQASGKPAPVPPPPQKLNPLPAPTWKQAMNLDFTNGPAGAISHEFDYLKTFHQDKAFRYQAKKPGSWFLVWHGELMKKRDHFIVEVEARMSDARRGGWGWRFCDTPGKLCLDFIVQHDGQVGINSGQGWIIPLRPAPTIKNVADWNTYRLEAVKDRLRIFVNETLAGETEYKALVASPVYPYLWDGERPWEVQFRCVRLWEPQPEVKVVPPPEVKEALGKEADLIRRYRGRLKVTASSVWAEEWRPERLIDGDRKTSWFSANGDSAAGGKKPWFQITFPEDITVQRVTVFGMQEPGYEPVTLSVVTGCLEFYGQNGKLLDTQTSTVKGNAIDHEFQLTTPLPGVRSVKFTSLADRALTNQWRDIAIGEIKVE